jgi:hypothetical protein
VTAAREDPAFDEALIEPFVDVAFPPDPAWTVTAEAFAAPATADALLAFEVPFPLVDPPAWTVIAPPAVVVVFAPESPAAVKVDE